jgi:hypothetical protein
LNSVTIVQVWRLLRSIPDTERRWSMALPLREGTFNELRAWPAGESFEDTMRKGRRAVAKARAAAEDVVAGASLQVRRHPLRAVGVAAVAGLATGLFVGFAAAWFIRARG